MRLLKKGVKAVLHGTGGIHLIRAANARKFRILMFHRFPAAAHAQLAWQCEYIRRYYHPVSLKTVADALDRRRVLPRNTVTITVDDGYADFFSHGWPVFREYGIPVTVYLVSGFLDRALWLWPDQVRFLFERTPLSSYGSFSLGTPAERMRAFLALCAELNLLANDERLDVMANLPAELRVELPADAPAAFAPMSWEQVRALAHEGVEFGAHTRTHPILSRIADYTRLCDEIGGSKSRIEQELRADVEHFCYPNGTAADINGETIDAVRAAGFRTAVTTSAGLNTVAADRYQLRRQGTDPDVARDYFAELLAGVRGHS